MFGPGGEFIHDSFVDLMAAGFSENQALKLIALMTAASDVFEGMPPTDFAAPEDFADEEEWTIRQHPANGSDYCPDCEGPCVE